MWLLHGADDVVFAGQQKVTFFPPRLFSLRSHVIINDHLGNILETSL